jgi:hypothetical protein
VGETAITAEDVSYRQAVVAIRSGEELPPSLALYQLIEEALMAEVGKAHAVVVSDEMLAAEAARVGSASRDPGTLAQIRGLFGDDEAAYERLVLQPILVNQLLHARFSLDHDIQAEPLTRAQHVLDIALADPASLPALATASGSEYGRLEIVQGHIHRDDGDEDENLLSTLAQYDVTWADYDREFIAQVVTGLAPGELHPQVVEDRYCFMVVRLLTREGEDAILETVTVPKLAFDPWFQAESQEVPLTVYDHTLGKALIAEVGPSYITDRLSTNG